MMTTFLQWFPKDPIVFQILCLLSLYHPMALGAFWARRFHEPIRPRLHHGLLMASNIFLMLLVFWICLSKIMSDWFTLAFHCLVFNTLLSLVLDSYALIAASLYVSFTETLEKLELDAANRQGDNQRKQRAMRSLRLSKSFLRGGIDMLVLVATTTLFLVAQLSFVAFNVEILSMPTHFHDMDRLGVQLLQFGIFKALLSTMILAFISFRMLVAVDGFGFKRILRQISGIIIICFIAMFVVDKFAAETYETFADVPMMILVVSSHLIIVM